MRFSILSVAIASEHDTVSARQRARQIARHLGFDAQDQTRISTAVSEIARNAFNYAGGGRVEYRIEGRTAPQLLLIKVTDSGPGIPNLQVILDGNYESETGMGLGITGARRLMDQFQIDSIPGSGTTVVLKKLLPKRAALVKQSDVARIADQLLRETPQNAMQELQHQNRELLTALEEIRARQTELVRLNRELEDTNRGVVALYAELDEKADHLRRADEVKSKFLSNMSHEFRSPLNSILALSGLLLDRRNGGLSTEQEVQAGYIRKAAQDLLELVNDLLDLAKVEAGKIEVKPGEFTAENLFAALRGMLRPLLLNQSVELIFEEVDDLPAIYSDEGKISQILRNFISNALKFTERGEVRVAAKAAGPDVIFSVSDTGIGIAPENLDLIFQDFVQVDNPIQRRVKGTGLGLPLSKKLAHLLGGEVTVESRLHSGSTFSVQIPLRYAEAAEPDSPAAIYGGPESADLPVLVIEDSPEMMLAYQSFLRGSGFGIVAAATIREGEHILERTRPVAIILDLILRSEDTWAFMARLQQDASLRHIPILVVSSVEDQGKAYHLGAAGYLVKPVDRSALLSRLQAIIEPPSPGRLLIIDDEERDRYLIRQHLRGSALLVSEAVTGADGIRQALAERPAGIILDLNMPDMTGFEVLDRLKQAPLTQNIPVIICTSRILTEAEKNELAKKTTAILNKQNLDRVTLERALEKISSGASFAATQP